MSLVPPRLMEGLPPVPCPQVGGKRTGEDPYKLLSHSHPQVGGNKERASENVLNIRESF
jgi:hypothetical protein